MPQNLEEGLHRAPGAAQVGEGGEGTGAPAPARPRHFAGFDGLRAIAALSVLTLHVAWASGFTMRSTAWGIFTSRLDIGVAVFFLISGFLLYRPFVASHLAGRPFPAVGRFWVRRLLRIVPAYWVALTVLAYGFHVISLGAGWEGPASHYLFLQIYFPTESFNGIGQAWSLCTEMSFYLFLPFYAWVVARGGGSGRWRLAREVGGLAVLVGVSEGFRWWALNRPLIVARHGQLVAVCAPNCSTHPALASLMVNWLPSYLDLFALGMILAVTSAWLAHRARPVRLLDHPALPWLSWLGAAAVFWWVSHIHIDREILYVITPRLNMARQWLYGLFSFLLLLPAVFGPERSGGVRRFLASRPMVWLGMISYGVYLWHLDLIHVYERWIGQPGSVANGFAPMPFWALLLPTLGLALAFAAGSYLLVERPVLRLKDRLGWWRGNRGAGAAGAFGSGSDAGGPEGNAVSA